MILKNTTAAKSRLAFMVVLCVIFGTSAWVGFLADRNVCRLMSQKERKQLVVGTPSSPNDLCCRKSHRPGCACDPEFACLEPPLICEKDADENGNLVFRALPCEDAQCLSQTGGTCSDLTITQKKVNLCVNGGFDQPCPAADPACPENFLGSRQCFYIQLAWDDSKNHVAMHVAQCDTGSTLCASQPNNTCE